MKEVDILNYLITKYKLKIEEANFSKGFIPKYILLDRTRNIHSYLFITEYDTIKLKGINLLIELYKIQYSQLDRPLFIVIEINDTVYFIDITNLQEIIQNENYLDDFLDFKMDTKTIIPIIKRQL